MVGSMDCVRVTLTVDSKSSRVFIWDGPVAECWRRRLHGGISSHHLPSRALKRRIDPLPLPEMLLESFESTEQSEARNSRVGRVLEAIELTAVITMEGMLIFNNTP